MYRVLIPVDEDEGRALHQARYAASLDGEDEVEATVLHVVPPNKRGGSADISFSDVDSAVGAAEHLASNGIEVNRKVANGGVTDRIIHTANELDSDEIVAGGRKRSGVAEVLLGSEVQDLLRSSDRPITITGTSMVIGERRRLLLPVNGNLERANHQAEYVENLSTDAEELQATVLHVFRHQDYKGAPPQEFGDVEAAVAAADRLEEAGVSVERQAIGGEIEDTILETAAESNAHGIIMGGRKRSGVQEVIIGSTTRDLMLSAELPITLTG